MQRDAAVGYSSSTCGILESMSLTVAPGWQLITAAGKDMFRTIEEPTTSTEGGGGQDFVERERASVRERRGTRGW